MKITRAAVGRPVTTVMFFLIVIVLSAVSLSRLPIDLMPDVTYPSISVVVDYPGAGPEEIENLVSRRIEEVMGSVSNVERVVTRSMEERAVVSIRFAWGSDLDEVANEVRQRIDRIRGSLPEDVEPPVLYKYDFNMSPILRLGIASPDLDLTALRTLAEKQLKPRLERLPGVASADVNGGMQREIQLNLNAEKLDALSISPLAVVAKVKAENLNLPGGEVVAGDLDLLVRTYGQYHSIDELSQVVVAVRDGVPIYLRDVADIEDGVEEVRQVLRINEVPGVSISIVKEASKNTVDVADAVAAEVMRIESEMPYLSVALLWDSSRFIRDAIDGVKIAALFGAALAIVVLLVFLRNVRSTFIIASAIPVAVMASFSLIYFCGFSLNIVSFGGLALGIGLLVDNSIVVLENIFRHRERGESGRVAAERGTNEVSMAIVASTLTTVVVFIPLLFLRGPAKVMFGQLSYIVAFSLLCSLVVALTLIPMLCRFLLRVESLDAAPGESLRHRLVRLSEAAFLRIENVYSRLLHGTHKHRVLVLFACASLFLMVLPLTRMVPFEYMPSTDNNEVSVYGEMAPGTRMETMATAFQALEVAVLENMPEEIVHLETRFGVSAWWRSSGGNSGKVEVALKDPSERNYSSQELADMLREKLPDIPGMRMRTRASGGLWMFRMLQSEGESIGVDIRGHDRDVAIAIAEQVKETMEGIDGITDARLDDIEPRPDVGLEIDRAKASEAGLSVSAIAQTIRTRFGGEVATLYREGGDEYNVRVRLRESDRTGVDSLSSLWLISPSGQRVPVSNFVRQRRGMGPTEIERIDQQRSVTVAANLDPEATLGNVMRRVEATLATMKLPKGYSIVYGGEYEDQQKSYSQLAMGLLLAVLLVYMVMASQFENLHQPFIIMFSIPFAVMGVVLALVLTDTTLNIQSILGTTMLSGIAVNNAIVLVDYINLLRRKENMPLRAAVEEGGRRRLRPILMTTATTMLALIPLSLGLGAGGEVQAPMARVVIGGLITSTIITLFFVPVLYTAVEELLEKFREKRADVTTDRARSEPEASGR
jgi:hydrophobic/amphiphilic exporter-1 (mainly G- bacteria), HAE1 family